MNKNDYHTGLWMAATALTEIANKWQIRRTRQEAAFDAELRQRLVEKTGQPISDDEWGAAKMLAIMIHFGLPEKLGISFHGEQ